MLVIYFGQEPNEITKFFLYAAKSRRRRNWTLRNFFAKTTRNEKFQKDIT